MSDAMPERPPPTPEEAQAEARAKAAARTEATAAGAPDERSLKERVVDVLCTIFDPEIPVNIYELGLIYVLDVDEATGAVKVDMTLTSPACPVAGTLPGEVEAKIRGTEGVSSVDLELVWEPPWDKSKLSDAAKLTLGLM